jgi:ABC-2 type transport system ATP-binding protein
VAEMTAVAKRYSPWGRWVLRDVDLAVDEGSTTAIVGSNGSGKSTLLRILAGASAPTQGAARRAGPAALVPERLPSSMRMTASAYVGHLGRMRDVPAEEIHGRMHELFDRLRLSPGPEVPVGSLSKGNSQKVALTQALLAPVTLLVLDEPFSGLDEDTIREVASLLTRARDDGAAVVISGHRPGDLPAADRVLTVADGRLG